MFLTLCDSMDCRSSDCRNSTRFICPWGFSRQEYWSGLSGPLWIFPNQGSNPGLQYSRWTLYSLSHTGKPKNIGVGSLSFLQGILPTQISSWDHLHCRQILYQLSYQESLKSQLLSFKIFYHFHRKRGSY